MTPKEKAKQLVDRFINEVTYKGGNDTTNTLLLIDEAKQCALICVDEIIDALIITLGHCDLLPLDWEECKLDRIYWEEVKQEIKKL